MAIITLWDITVGDTTHRITNASTDIVVGANTYVPEAIGRNFTEPQPATEFKPGTHAFGILEVPSNRVWWNRLMNPALGIGHPVVVSRIVNENPMTAEIRFRGQTGGIASVVDSNGIRCVIGCRTKYSRRGNVRQLTVEKAAHKALWPNSNIFDSVEQQRRELWD